MNTEDKTKILERVRKMLKLAKDAGATEGERDNALRMAHATLAKYNLDLAELESKGETTNDRGILKATFYGRPWARRVAQSVAEMLFCDYLYLSISKTKDVTHLFVGRETNAITASEMTSYLVESINREAKKFQRDRNASNDTYRSFAWGAAVAIERRCHELRQAAEKDSGRLAAPAGRGLIVYQANEHKENQAVIKKAFPKVTGSRSGKNIDDVGATLAGHSYGKSVSLNRQVSDSSVPHLRLK